MPESLRILLRFALLLVAVLLGALLLTEPVRLVVGGAIAGASIALGLAYLAVHAVRLALALHPELAGGVWACLWWEGARARAQTRLALAALVTSPAAAEDETPEAPPPAHADVARRLDKLNSLAEQIGDVVIELEGSTGTRSEMWPVIADLHEQVERWRARLAIADAERPISVNTIAPASKRETLQ